MGEPIRLACDVLVIGGGMAAAWAAIAAAEAGAHVAMVDKGYCGTSGVTATGGPNHWWVPEDPALRAQAIARQSSKAQGLADEAWMEQILALTFRHLPTLAPWYPFGSDGAGGIYHSGVRGPEYMRALRSFALARGVTILDHHPALELLADREARVSGARGHALRHDAPWDIRAGATILATGGCAFRSGLIGSALNTGDGYLMGAEAGAELSGMEFSIAFSLSPAWASTRTLPFTAARFFDEAGHEIDVPSPRAGHAHHQALGRAMLAGPVYADLSEAPAALPPILHRIQPLTTASFARAGIDPFRQRFPVRLFGEGTIRGTGGLRILDQECRTSVAGLFAAGDAATRELVAGAASGGGAVNSAWALSSGRIAGEAAAREARPIRPDSALTGLGRAGLHPTAEARALDQRGLAASIESHMHHYDRALFRRRASLSASLDTLGCHWDFIAAHGQATGAAALPLRELAAMAATARWCTAAALARDETRGVHVRIDAPDLAPSRGHRLIVGGLDTVRLRPDVLLEDAA
ncbi:FAD-binding protein [Novosphingobium rosa]|uniref:FAD-binding protein n=1 Tax=Novosphingobium rosa TaxID=76978 RepID=UPI000836DE4A|nr:FAD-binding protein [Novosphingobium rosa]